MNQYASYQGRVYLANRDANGNPIDARTPGNVADLKISLKMDTIDHYESSSGQRALDHRLTKSKNASISLTLEEFTAENLALADLAHAVADYQAARRLETLAAQSLAPQAEVAFQSALAAYENGRLDFATLLDAQRQLRQARLSAIKAHADAQLRLAEIEKAVGESL